VVRMRGERVRQSRNKKSKLIKNYFSNKFPLTRVLVCLLSQTAVKSFLIGNSSNSWFLF
jgi:hypothetical protein